MSNRDEVIGLLNGLPQTTVATGEEVLRLIEQEALYAGGIGYIDAHLLASARLTPDASVWTMDKRLSALATRLGVVYQPTSFSA
jgi:hypothetical protein